MGLFPGKVGFMKNFFNLDNPVWSFFSKLADAFLLSVLWTLTSIPIFTIGASNAAMYYVLLKLLDEKDVKVVRSYFNAFKDNFKIATKIWVPLLIVMLVGLTDVYICIMIGGYTGFVGAIIFMCAEIILVLFNIYIFPLIGRFENKIRQSVKNGFLMPIKHFLCTLWIMIVIIGVVALGFVFPPIIIFLPGVMAFAISYPMYYVFKKYTPTEADPMEVKLNLYARGNKYYNEPSEDMPIDINNKNSNKKDDSFKRKKKKDNMF